MWPALNKPSCDPSALPPTTSIQHPLLRKLPVKPDVSLMHVLGAECLQSGQDTEKRLLQRYRWICSAHQQTKDRYQWLWSWANLFAVFDAVNPGIKPFQPEKGGRVPKAHPPLANAPSRLQHKNVFTLSESCLVITQRKSCVLLD